MARIRTIKPEFWSDEKLAPLSPTDRLVFLGLVTLADDCGRILDNLKVLNAAIFPYTDDSAEISLETLAKLERIQRGKTSSGQNVIQIVNWKRHQKVDKPNLMAALPAIFGQPDPSECVANSTVVSRESVASDSPPIPTTNDQRSTTNDRGAGLLSATPTSLPKELLALVDLWNDIAPKHGLPLCQFDPPPKKLMTLWAAAQADPVLRDSLINHTRLRDAISEATFAHGKPWFSLPGLFTNNKDGESKLLQLLNGAYKNGTNKHPRSLDRSSKRSAYSSTWGG